ncbi:MAG: phage tail protein [Bacteroidota bacterium]
MSVFDLPIPPGLDPPMVGFRFGVFFLGKIGVSHPLDFRFKSVSGLNVNLETETIGDETGAGGGFNRPKGLTYSNLVLERGLPMFSTLSREIQSSFQQFKFKPRNVLLSVLSEDALPLKNWLIKEAYPVKWSISGLDAAGSQVIVENLELTYSSFKSFSL